MAERRSSRNRNDDGLERRHKQEPEEEQLQQQEEQQEAERRQEQQRDAAQDALGNSGVASMLGLVGIKPGESGFSAGALQAPEEQQSLQFGGDDDPQDGPLTLDDLVRSWNPSTRRGQDAPPGALGTLDGLPDEDQELLDAVRRDPLFLAGGAHGFVELPTVVTPDPLVQPSEDLVVRDLRALVRQVGRWSPGTLVHRTVAGVLSPPARCLVDPAGQLVHTRARVAAAATLLLLDAFGEGLSPAVSSVVAFTLELSARSAWIDRALDLVRERQTRLPQAADLVVGLLGEAPAGRDAAGPAELPPGVAEQIAATLVDLLDVPTASTLLPSLSAEVADAGEPEDDPLDVDGVLAAALGAQDPLAGVYDAALQGAERLAGGAARLRIHGAGLVAAVAEVCDQWSAGAPRHTFGEIVGELDREVAEALQLLVEIGRAIQARAVPPPGIRNGLRRVARSLDAAGSRLVARLVPVIGGVLPGVGEVHAPAAPVEDPLAAAWAEGAPGDALPWLAAQPAGLERDVAVVCTRAAAARDLDAAGWAELADRADREQRWALAGALRLGAAAGRIRAGDPAGAAALAERGVAEAFARRNGVWLAAAALVAIDAHRLAGDTARADTLRRRAAGACWRLGARAGLTLLLRWRAGDPADADDLTGSAAPT